MVMVRVMRMVMHSLWMEEAEIVAVVAVVTTFFGR
jgi:hypothetical protein